jgi:hypothetical protein
VAAREGMSLSAKYEIDDGAFQLSVYAVKADGTSFVEVIVDCDAAFVAKVIDITDGGDLAAAQAQKMVMARARRALATATSSAVTANAGYRAVIATPIVRAGRPIAEVTLLGGEDWKVVGVPLD